MSELAARADYAKNIHTDKALSRLIQRSLEGERAEQIATYLERTEERFFNSLVLATYEGKPEWLEIGTYSSGTDSQLADRIDEQGLDTIGFLSLTGEEKIFAVDGQHRLAGIKKSVSAKTDFGLERIPVIFIAHNEEKRERTRRLFTTLNKTAKPVKKRDIIALDEDDTMAIVLRKLIEQCDWFTSPKILIEASENLPATNRVSLTTISNLYDVLKLIFRHRLGQKSDIALRFYRPSDKELDRYYAYALKYFSALANNFRPIKDLYESTIPATVTHVQRGEHGGHFLFRPIGLSAFTSVVIQYSKFHEVSLPLAVDQLSVLPMELNQSPYSNVVWDVDRKKIISSGKRLITELLSYMAGLPADTLKLEAAYQRALGYNEKVQLPARLISPKD